MCLFLTVNRRDGKIVLSSCVSKENFGKCARMGGVCETKQDGFFLLAWPSFIYGLIWSVLMSKQFDTLRVSLEVRYEIDCKQGKMESVLACLLNKQFIS